MLIASQSIFLHFFLISCVLCWSYFILGNLIPKIIVNTVFISR